MTRSEFKQLKAGDKLKYQDDSSTMFADVDGWFGNGLIVWFDRRASSTTLFEDDRKWLDHISQVKTTKRATKTSARRSDALDRCRSNDIDEVVEAVGELQDMGEFD